MQIQTMETVVMFIYGCTDSTAFNYNEMRVLIMVHVFLSIYGCTDPTAFNYDLILMQIQMMVLVSHCFWLYGCNSM